MSAARVYWAVAGAAVIAYLGAVANGFVLDDIPIVIRNSVVHDPAGWWRAFAAPYWGPEEGGSLYRPLAVATYWLDGRLDGAPWFHLVNILWHAGASLMVVTLTRRLVEGEHSLTAALIGGLIFAVHPVHVEAVANVVGRAELMAALFACLGVYAALVRGSVAWSAAALVGAVLSKESGAVVPGLVAWAWVLGIGRPPRRKMIAFVASWVLVAVAYGAGRWAVLHQYSQFLGINPLFVGEPMSAVRLTAVAALADVVRLLVFPLHLRADYSPAERTIVHSALDARFVLGLGCLALWAALLWMAWRRRRTVETLGLGWLAIAYLPVANFLFPIGILVAERTLYLPSVGLSLAAGAWLARWPTRMWALTLTVIVVAGGVRAALRVPVWRTDERLTLSILEDSPRSYVGPARTADHIERAGQKERALEYLRIAIAQYDRDPRPFYAAADLAYTLGRPQLADSMLERAEVLCRQCRGYYEMRAGRARFRGDSATARWLLEHLRP